MRYEKNYSKFLILILINTKCYFFAECSCFHDKLINHLQAICLAFIFPFNNFVLNC